jgi:hypothetical protein
MHRHANTLLNSACLEAFLGSRPGWIKRLLPSSHQGLILDDEIVDASNIFDDDFLVTQ